MKALALVIQRSPHIEALRRSIISVANSNMPEDKTNALAYVNTTHCHGIHNYHP
jgi:hypothetical protein